LAGAAAAVAGTEVDAAGGVTASAFFSTLACCFSSLFFSLGFGSSGFTSFVLAGAGAGEAETAVADGEPFPPGTNGCASLGSGLLDSAAGTKGAAVGAKENENCPPPPPPPGTNSHAPGLNENSFAFGLSGMY
jgi:hypothetical protein